MFDCEQQSHLLELHKQHIVKCIFAYRNQRLASLELVRMLTARMNDRYAMHSCIHYFDRMSMLATLRIVAHMSLAIPNLDYVDNHFHQHRAMSNHPTI